jgi:Uma2 family endonuclease
MAAAPQPNLTPEQYLEIERAAETKSEYFDGEMFAMSGASAAHVLISGNLAFHLRLKIGQGRCTSFGSDMKVRTGAAGLYTYPDLSVAHGQALFGDEEEDVLLNPVVIFEVLSPSTEAYDRGLKFDQYRSIESLRHYVLVSQHRPLVECHTRQGDLWVASISRGLDAVLRLESLECELSMHDVYEGVRLPEVPPARFS